jgi:hypothetical protein
MLEMEYQKRFRWHGTNQRPDIIFHIPKEISGEPCWKNNYAVWELKRAGSIKKAQGDFHKLDYMCGSLKYALAIFINVASHDTHLTHYNGRFRERIHAFAVPLSNTSKILHSYFENDVLSGASYDL